MPHHLVLRKQRKAPSLVWGRGFFVSPMVQFDFHVTGTRSAREAVQGVSIGCLNSD